MRIALVCALLLAGCAASPEKVQQAAYTAPDSELCQVYVTGRQEYVAILGAEIRRRHLDCKPYWDEMEARERVQNQQAQRNAANAAATLQILRSMQPPPPPITPIAPSVNCTSRVIGNQAQTICN
jgi:hypothetical protein